MRCFFSCFSGSLCLQLSLRSSALFCRSARTRNLINMLKSSVSNSSFTLNRRKILAFSMQLKRMSLLITPGTLVARFPLCAQLFMYASPVCTFLLGRSKADIVNSKVNLRTAFWSFIKLNFFWRGLFRW